MSVAAPIETDALVIGAGPVGLWQVFQLGLQDVRAHVVDALPHAGGQPAELYPDKPIYDIPGLPVCSGRELVDRLLLQVKPFAPTLHLGQSVSALAREEDGRWAVQTTAGQRFLARLVFIAAGVGAFQPKRLKLDGIEAFEGEQVHHRFATDRDWSGQHVVVHGGDELAIDWALRLLDSPAPPDRLSLLHRREVLQSDDGAALARVQDTIARGRARLVVGQPVGLVSAGNRLQALQVLDPQGETQALALDQLVVALGLSPRLGPIADWGLAMDRKQLVVNTDGFEASEAGLYAVGDINTYPGKKKLILCGFHEATLAAFAAAARLRPDQRVPLQYTTTSPRLHQLLGVAPR
ncbi:MULTISPECIES: NAD(P)/FAD-dependent oxidoreductase [Hydrogenophaga]|uniref:Ferredoxin--NADP reductase n=1 Tax=Hydrogenophaga intermedia TaxID=65786 RepID=A0A1L1PET0_HYDIT|nr:MULTISPECIES: NAD(P)/FAD-dependent oxidoreductase [Hydrogenophaga]AOS79768.1 ferredoxin--NADP(+) reductase [Hydrogenophaga sp. PBC]TMU77317.1 NAD(P)/FAD-dependent oxidoreductase [Hydrogenophaga intermedia]CDN87304.1 Ferredoxin--NADP reductase [Hydrogenophaga intermedia]